ncbi:hypothetical protein AAMO2058_000083900 [Amorphochlora amoebiformis]
MAAWEEVNKVFDAVSTEKFEPLIKGYTFRTIQVPLEIREAAAMVAKHDNVHTARDSEILDVLAFRLDEIINQNFNGKVFAKLSDLSPKDVPGDSVKDLWPIVEARLREMREASESKSKEDDEKNKTVAISNKDMLSLAHGSSNRTLQCLIYSKAQGLGCGSGRDIIEMLCRSHRCMVDELKERKGYPHNPTKVSIVLREWLNVDPAFELRGFVNKGELRGLSQMATMNIGEVHYPQVIAYRDELKQAAVEFYNKKLKNALEPIAKICEPLGRFVIDFYYHVPTDKWYVIEINPWMTSAQGHLFKPYPAAWAAWDRKGSTGCEIRLHPFTSASVLTDPGTPSQKLISKILQAG